MNDQQKALASELAFRDKRRQQAADAVKHDPKNGQFTGKGGSGSKKGAAPKAKLSGEAFNKATLKIAKAAPMGSSKEDLYDIAYKHGHDDETAHKLVRDIISQNPRGTFD